MADVSAPRPSLEPDFACGYMRNLALMHVNADACEMQNLDLMHANADACEIWRTFRIHIRNLALMKAFGLKRLPFI